MAMFVTRTAIGLAMGMLLFSGVAFSATPDGKTIPTIELAQALIDAEQFEQAVTVLKQLDAQDGVTTAQIDLLFGRIYLGIGKTTVQQWEQGQKKPSGPAQRLLDLIDRKGLSALS
jgi:predicted negative regulator of RcsB-dependent stress response